MATQLTLNMLRSYIKDTPSMNKVFAGVEFLDKDYEQALFWGKEKIASIPPFIEDFPISRIPLETQRIGALAALFEAAALLAGRNKSNLSEQGLPVPVGENADVYERWAAKYEGDFRAKVHEYKVAYNMMQSFRRQRGVYSKYPDRGR